MKRRERISKNFQKKFDKLDALVKKEGSRKMADAVRVCPDCLGSDFEQIVDAVFLGEGVAVPTTEKRCKQCGFEGIPIEMSAKDYAKIARSKIN